MLTMHGPFGQGVPASTRVPFNRPRPADPNLTPHILRTRYQSHLHPFESILPSAVSFRPGFPTGSGAMQPSFRRPTALPAPEPAATAGFGATSYTSMRTGMDIPFRQTAGHIRSRATRAGALIRSILSPGYPYAGNPAGHFRSDIAY